MKRTILSLIMGIALSTTPALASHSYKHHGKSHHTHVISHNKHKYRFIPEFSGKAESEINCIAKNIYHEAGGESHKGKVAVFAIMRSRKNHPHFAKTFCGVTYERGQFSWVGRRNKTPPGSIIQLARELYNNQHKVEDPTGGALYFHSGRKPKGWNVRFKTQIGGHRFYG